MIPHKSTLVLLSSLALAACSGGGADRTDDKEDNPDGEALELEIGEPEAGFQVDVTEASLDGDLLTMTLEHGGGCGDHNYRLFWDGQFRETIIEIAELKVRDETDDLCEGFVFQEVTFNIAEIRKVHGAEEGEVLLSIENFDEEKEAPLYKWSRDLPGITIGEIPAKDPELVISDASIEGNVLAVEVGYPGGCQEHEFELYWDGLYIETVVPQVDLAIFHENNGDACEAFIFETIEFDISELGAGPLIVNLDGWAGDLGIEGDDQAN
jgi:hypothetical protein